MTETPETSNPFSIMRRHGFGEYILYARRALPESWWQRYELSPNQVARGLTYYVAYDDYTQEEIADMYGYTHGQSVSLPYRVLREDLGKPQKNDAFAPLTEWVEAEA